jgi:hypothetical protein
MKGMTAKQSGSALERADKRSVNSDRLDHVLRTGGIKPAALGKEWRKKKLINPDQADKRLAED